MLWFDRMGMLLQFIAVFLMAPELLGQSGLHRFRQAISLGIQLSVLLPLGAGLIIITWAVTFRELAEHLHRIVASGILSLVVALVVYGGMLLVRRHVLSKLVEDLEDDEALRRRLLLLGGFLFSGGFFLQFSATFM